MEKVKISCFSKRRRYKPIDNVPPFRFHCLLLMSKNDSPQLYHHPVRATCQRVSRDKQSFEYS